MVYKSHNEFAHVFACEYFSGRHKYIHVYKRVWTKDYLKIFVIFAYELVLHIIYLQC